MPAPRPRALVRPARSGAVPAGCFSWTAKAGRAAATSPISTTLAWLPGQKRAARAMHAAYETRQRPPAGVRRCYTVSHGEKRKLKQRKAEQERERFLDEDHQGRITPHGRQEGRDMGELGNACRARAAECVLVARAVGWRGVNGPRNLLSLGVQFSPLGGDGDQPFE